MIPYIIIGVLLIVVGRLLWQLSKYNNLIKVVDKELKDVYRKYLDEHYHNCLNFSITRRLVHTFKNVLDDASEVVVDLDVKKKLVDFSSELSIEEQNLLNHEKSSEEFMVKYEIEKLTRGL